MLITIYLILINRFYIEFYKSFLIFFTYVKISKLATLSHKNFKLL